MADQLIPYKQYKNEARAVSNLRQMAGIAAPTLGRRHLMQPFYAYGYNTNDAAARRQFEREARHPAIEYLIAESLDSVIGAIGAALLETEVQPSVIEGPIPRTAAALLGRRHDYDLSGTRVQGWIGARHDVLMDKRLAGLYASLIERARQEAPDDPVWTAEAVDSPAATHDAIIWAGFEPVDTPPARFDMPGFQSGFVVPKSILYAAA